MVEKTYGIKIVSADPVFPVKTFYGAIDGKAAVADDLRNYSRLFAAEFSLYALSLVKKTRLKRVIFCRTLSFAGQRRTAIPDFEHDDLYFDVESGKADPIYLRKVIHHEFFHIVDLRDDGKLYEDERWKNLNPSEFKYGTGGKNAQNVSDTATLTEKYPGFLNHYSTTGVEEDKAEVFANLIVDAVYVAQRAQTDRVLSAKAERMKELVAEFCAEMDGAFWRARLSTEPPPVTANVVWCKTVVPVTMRPRLFTRFNRICPPAVSCYRQQ